MTDIMINPDELDPTNGNEKNNLQNNSEESTHSEVTEKKSPTHDPELFKRIIEEIERKEAEEEQKPEIKPVAPTRDPSVWEHKSDEVEENSKEETQPENAETNNGSGRRHFRKDNRRIADLKRTKTQKEKKSERLQSEIDSHQADIDRGYLIVKLGDDSERVKHVQLEVSDKAIIKSVISEKEYEKFELSLDISEIDSKIRELAAAKRSSYKDRLSKKKASKIENDLVKRVVKELSEASKNGGKEIVSNIHQQVQSGKKDVAYDSLKFFLSQQVKPVAKKLDKDAKLEKNVLDKVIDKLSTSQS